MDKLLADGQSIWRDQLSDAEFSKRVTQSFPEVAALREDEGSLHLQVATLGRELLSRIYGGDKAGASAILAFFDSVLTSAEPAPEVENALGISFPSIQEICSTELGGHILAEAPTVVRRRLSPD